MESNYCPLRLRNGSKCPANFTAHVMGYPQKILLIHIYLIMSFLRPPKALTKIAPPSGDNSTGVRNDMPGTPYFNHSRTYLLFFLVNIFLSFEVKTR